MISKTIQKESDNMDEGETSEKVPREVLLIAQQIKIARSLASNDLRQRTKQLKKLRKWLHIRANSSYPFSDDDFLRVWKGLFYCMWMSDKPLVQENLAEDLGSLLQCFQNPDVSAQFFGAFLETMSLEWFGIDQWRMDKFLMLIRRMLRHMFQVLRDAKWKKKHLIAFNKYLKSTVLSECESSGLIMHVVDIYLEELAKVADGEISRETVSALVKPYVRFLATQDDPKLLSHVRRNIFYHLLWQSDVGREFTEKFNAWKEMGFPTPDINDLEKVGEEDVEDEDNNDDEDSGKKDNRKNKSEQTIREKHLDPRAGCVDVDIPELPVDVEPIIKEFEKLQFDDITNTKSRKFLRDILSKYKTYRTGEFPLGVKKMPRIELEPLDQLIDSKVDEFEKFEDELYLTTRKLKQLSKKKRKKILQSINVNSGDVNEDNYEQMLAEAIPAKRPKLNSSQKLHNEWQEEDVDETFADQTIDNIYKLKDKLTKQSNSDKKQKKVKATLLNENSVNIKKKKQKKRKLSATYKAVNGFTETSFDETEVNVNSLQKSSKNDPKKKKSKNVKSENKSDESHELAAKEAQTNKKQKTPKSMKKRQQSNQSEWEKPLEDGEVEYFVPSRKIKLNKANQLLQTDNNENLTSQSNLVLNPFAKKHAEKKLTKKQLLGKALKKAHSLKNVQNTATSGSSAKKRVKIVLQNNSAQKPCEYIKQVLSSPQLPYDAEKKPAKGLLKPNLMPSPINPFYKKKIGLKLND